ncbi:Nuclear pore complex protein Nup98-Nup96 [Cleaved into: Nuclear pore complex protein Nup98 (Nucleoporin Nup98) (Nup98), partial [Durusdinium trenchii]
VEASLVEAMRRTTSPEAACLALRRTPIQVEGDSLAGPTTPRAVVGSSEGQEIRAAVGADFSAAPRPTTTPLVAVVGCLVGPPTLPAVGSLARTTTQAAEEAGFSVPRPVASRMAVPTTKVEEAFLGVQTTTKEEDYSGPATRAEAGSLALAATPVDAYATGPSSQMARHIALAKQAWEPVSNDEPSKSSSASSPSKPDRNSSSGLSSASRNARTPIGKLQVRPRGYGRTAGAVAAMVKQDKAGTEGSGRRGRLGPNGTPATSSKAPDLVLDKVAGSSLNNSNVLSPGVFDLNKRLSIKKGDRERNLSTPAKLPPNGSGLKALRQNGDSPLVTTSQRRGSGGGGMATPLSTRRSPSGETPARGGDEEEEERHVGEPAADEDGDEPVLLSKTVATALSSPVKSVGSKQPNKAAVRKFASASCPVMSKELIAQGYTTTPRLVELQRMTDEELASVGDFSVAREGFGKVAWLGHVDVRGLDIDEVVEISHMSIEVYKNEQDTPKRGTKLNRPAICTIEHMEIPSDFLGTKQEFVQWLRDDYTPQLDAVFLDYDLDSATWTFKVQHFTKYGFGGSSSTPYPSRRQAQQAAVSVEDESLQLMEQEDMPQPQREEPHARGVMGDFDSVSPPSAPPHAAPMLTPFGRARRESRTDGTTAEDIVHDSRFTTSEALVLPRGPLVIGQDPFEELDQVTPGEGPTMEIFRRVEASLASTGGMDCVNKYASDNKPRPATRFLRRSFGVSWGPNGEIAFGLGTKAHVLRLDVGASPDVEARRLDILRDASAYLPRRDPAIETEQTKEDAEDAEDEVLKQAVLALMQSSMAANDLHEHQVWHLIYSLWFGAAPCGAHPRESGARPTALRWNEWRDAFPSQLRVAGEKQAHLSEEWLDSMDTWLKATLCQPEFVPNWSSDIAKALSCKQLERACELAAERGDLRLCTLVAQAAGELETRRQLAEQVALWTRNQAEAQIDSETLNVYKILSGDITEEQADKDGHWLRALALNVWFTQDPFAKLGAGVKGYADAFASGAAPAPRTPWYDSSFDDNLSTFDTLYHVIQLACSPEDHPIGPVLDPRGHSEHLLNHGMQWLMHQVLRSFGVFGRDLSKTAATKLCFDYILELEVVGLWHYAVLVAQFLPDEAQRERFSRELLGRHANQELVDGAVLRFLREEVVIPETWISEAFAIFTRANFMRSEEISYLMAADHVAEAIEIINEKVAPNAIIDGDHQLLDSMFSDLAQRAEIKRQADMLEPWAVRISLYLHYIKLHKLQDSPDCTADELRDELEALGSSLIKAQANPATALDDDTAAQIGTWIRIRILAMRSHQHHQRPITEAEFHSSILPLLNLPAKADSMRSAVLHFTKTL